MRHGAISLATESTIDSRYQRFDAFAHLSHGRQRPNHAWTRTFHLDFPASIVNAAQFGDRSAVMTLFRAAWPAAYRIAWSILGDAAASEDAAQSACARALGALDTLRSSDRFAPWFYRIVVNEAKQLLRATARERPFESVPVDRTASWHEEMRAHDDRIDVRGAIDALEPGLRAAIVLRYYFGMSSAEIGRILSTSSVTARWRLMIAHRRLRALLEPSAGPDFPIVEEPCG